MEVIGKNLKEFKEIDNLLEEKKIFEGSRLFKCILGLNKTESLVFGYILKNEDVATSELKKVLKMDRSSMQRAVQPDKVVLAKPDKPVVQAEPFKLPAQAKRWAGRLQCFREP